MDPSRYLRVFALSSSIWMLSPCALAAGPTASFYFGGSGDDSIEGVAFAGDGSILISGNSTSTDLFDSERQVEAGDGFVARLDRGGSKVLWVTRVSSLSTGIDLTSSGNPVVASGNRLINLDLADGNLAAEGTFDGTVAAFDVGQDDRVAVVVGTTVVVRAADLTEEFWRTDVGRDHPWSVAFTPDGQTVYVSGDTNAGDCNGPYRSPFLFGFDAQGQKISTFLDPSGAVACGEHQLQADSFFTRVSFDATGALWLTGGADGGNTVLQRDPSNLADENPALSGACYASACYGWKGAAAPGFVGRMNAARDSFDRATFIVSHFNVEHDPCSCDVTNPSDGAVRANSAGLKFVFTTSQGTVVGAGASAWHYPSKAAWYPAAAYTPGYPAVVSVFDSQLTKMSMATMLPGTGSTNWAAYRGGRLAVVGAAADNSTWTPPAGQEAFAQATVTPLPAGAALQSNYGGGAKDGFVYIACVTDDAECDAPPGPSLGVGGSLGMGDSGNGPANSDGDSTAAGCGCVVSGRSGGGSALGMLVAALALVFRRCKRMPLGGA